jgi:hypothetical protein
MTNVVQEGVMALVERASKKYHEWGDTDSRRTIIAEWALRDWDRREKMVPLPN